MPDTSDIQMQLDQLRQDYFNRLPNRLQEIEAYWQQLSRQWQPETLNILHRLVHSLTGTSATLHFKAMSETSQRLERQLQRWITHSPSPIEWQQANSLLLELKLSLELNQASDQTQVISSISQQLSIQTTINKRLVFLIDEDAHAAQELMLQISYFGYEIQIFDQFGQLKQAITETMPAAIIISLEVSAEHNLEEIMVLNQQCTPDQIYPSTSPFIIFVSSRDNLTERLRAVRAGGDAYFTKPLNINEFVDTLDQLIQGFQLDPYRVLIVEDDRELAEFHALILKQAGILTHLVTNPAEILQPLSEFKPDLILMDIYMPFCNGLELAAVIRQQVTYVSIPIVFLSTETDVNKQLNAMSLGGDDFLTKPIQPEHLISSIVSRAQRSSTLRSYMVRDGLTGLFNHTKLKEQLAIELKRAHRQNSQLAFVMIDIDHFKRVNDTYGHSTGDRVIKSLSRLLQQRLRQTDIIGRYGGEEFAVILVDTDATAAAYIMNQIRQSFAFVQQWAEDSEFNTTFSCGIALSSSYQTVAQISKAADEALYQAKRTGRNQVMLAANS